jgi:hypothetical protein
MKDMKGMKFFFVFFMSFMVEYFLTKTLHRIEERNEWDTFSMAG